MRKYTLLLIGSLFVASCSAHWVERQYVPYRAGVVGYLNQGADAVIDDRRQDALSKITEFCGADGYTIMGEGFQDRTTGAVTTPFYGVGLTSFTTSNYAQVSFRCGTVTASSDTPQTRQVQPQPQLVQPQSQNVRTPEPSRPLANPNLELPASDFGY